MPFTKNLSVALVAAGLSLAICPVTWAATPAPFSDPAFQAAQKQGKPILVEITASWCPVCAKQRPILSQLLADPRFRDMVVYNVDFDAQKDVVRELGAHMQSTLIVFDGSVEKGRSTGVSDSAAIEALLAKANG